MKKFSIIIGVLAVAFAAFYYFTPSFETIVKKIVHKYGSEVTGTDVNIGGFKLSLTNGEGSINNLTVANPSNYKTPNLFSVGEVFVKVDIKSLTKEAIIIEEIRINKPIISYEMLSLTQNNIKQVLNNVNNFAAKSASNQEGKPAQKEESKDSDPSKKVIIKKLTVNGGEIQASANIQGQDNNLVVALPMIEIKGIGEAQGGANVAETISKVLSQILNTASQVVVNSQLSNLENVAKENLDNVIGGVKDRLKVQGIFAQ